MKSQLSLITLALLNTPFSYANLFTKPSETVENIYHSRVTGQFLTGGEQQLGGWGDAMIPFMQNPSNILFADGGVMVGQEQRITISGGLGYRGIKQPGLNQGIVGAYLFTDYYQTRFNNQYWQLNPGIEWLDERYEARLQGYIPLNQRNQTYRNTFATEIPDEVLRDSGKPNTLGGATGHRLINTPVNLLEIVGPGIEFEAGHFVNYGKGFWARIGGYHFNYNHAKNINGVEANIEAVINNNISLLLQNNYDNQNKNRFAVGLRINFGGSAAPINSLEKQMTSPIIRHLARQSYGDALPTRRSFQASGPTKTLFDNVWFFSPEGTLPIGSATTFKNCTAEHPCSTIDSATATQISLLAPDANLFFESGTYQIPSHAVNQNNWVNLQDGQSFYGRNTGWMTAATGNDRPLINGSLIWGQSNTLLANGAVYNMRINNTNQLIPSNVFNLNVPSLEITNDSVLTLAATGNIIVENSDIQGSNLSSDNVSVLGIVAINNIVMNDVTISTLNQANATVPSAFASSIGVAALNNVAINNSTINALTSGTSNNIDSFSQAIGLQTNNDVTVTNTTINTLTTGNASNGGNNAAISVAASHNATVIRSTLNALTRGNSTSGGNNSAVSLITNNDSIVTESTFNTQVSGNADGATSFNQAYGIRARNNAIISNLTFNTLATGNATNGGNNGAFSVLALNNVSMSGSTINSQITGDANGVNSINQAFGIQALNSVTMSNSIINISSSGNAINGGFNNALGVFNNSDDVTVADSSITVKSTGAIDGASFTSALGIATPDSVNFQGNTASFITAMSLNGIAVPISSFSVNNNSTPPSGCSTDGIHFSPCA